MGITELILIGIVAILVVSPRQLPSLMGRIAKIIRGAKSLSNQARKHIDDELKLSQLQENEQRAAKADKTYQNDND